MKGEVWAGYVIDVLDLSRYKFAIGLWVDGRLYFSGHGSIKTSKSHMREISWEYIGEL